MTAYDSTLKVVWPMLDLTTLVSFAIVRGLMMHFAYSVRGGVGEAQLRVEEYKNCTSAQYWVAIVGLFERLCRMLGSWGTGEWDTRGWGKDRWATVDGRTRGRVRDRGGVQ